MAAHKIILALALALPFGLGAGAPAHRGHGVVLEIQDHGKALLIKHQAIPGFMPAMTMTFALADPALAAGLKPGQAVDFTVTQRGNFWPITALRRSAARPKPASQPAPGAPPQ